MPSAMISISPLDSIKIGPIRPVLRPSSAVINATVAVVTEVMAVVTEVGDMAVALEIITTAAAGQLIPAEARVAAAVSAVEEATAAPAQEVAVAHTAEEEAAPAPALPIRVVDPAAATRSGAPALAVDMAPLVDPAPAMVHLGAPAITLVTPATILPTPADPTPVTDPD